MSRSSLVAGSDMFIRSSPKRRRRANPARPTGESAAMQPLVNPSHNDRCAGKLSGNSLVECFEGARADHHGQKRRGGVITRSNVQRNLAIDILKLSHDSKAGPITVLRA